MLNTKREATINNYIFTAQVLFSLMAMIIILKYFEFENYNLSQAIIVTLIFIFFLIGISYYSILLNKQSKTIDFTLILLDFSLITFLFLITGYLELRFLYLIPIIITAIRFNLMVSIVFPALVGIINLVLDLIYINNLPVGYSIETDLIFLIIYILIGWLIGNFVKIESTTRNNLFDTQEKLTKQSSLLKNLINEMPLCVVVIDKQENIVHINQVAIDYAGIQDKLPEEFIGAPYRNYMDVLFKNYTYQELLILDTLHNGKSYFKEKVIRDNKLIETIFNPIYDSNDNIIYAMGIFYDITAEELINERLRSLERLTLVGQMGASIAHEIKNPLTTIKGFLQLSKKSNEKLTENQLELLISEIERCNEIITDFLSVSKKSNKNKTMTNLKNILDMQLILIERDAILANVVLQVDMDEEVYLSVNENEIKQLFLNLTHNALEAMPEGGNLFISLKNTMENVLLEIQDEGEGIPEGIIDKIGTPFLTTKKDGTGLGISVCQRIAEGHNAKLEITSKIGEGTKVKVAFAKN